MPFFLAALAFLIWAEAAGGTGADAGGQCDLGSGSASVSVAGRVVSWRPRVIVFDNFLSPEEVESLRGKAADLQWKAARTFSDRKNKRQSRIKFLNSAEELRDHVVMRVKTRIANVTHLPIENGESIQFQRYKKGGFYTAHIDPKEDVPRVASFLLYLNTVRTGGETFFPKTRPRFRNDKELAMDLEEVCKPSSGALLVPAVAGRGVLFYNYNLEGDIDDLSLHGSCPTTSDEKLIMQQWIHLEPVRYYNDPAMIGIWKFAEMIGPRSRLVPEEAGRAPLQIVGGSGGRLVHGVMGLAVAEGRKGTIENPLQHAVILGTREGCAKHTDSRQLLFQLADRQTFTVGIWFNIVEAEFARPRGMTDEEADVKTRHTLFRLYTQKCKQFGFELAVNRHMKLIWRVGDTQWNTQESFKVLKDNWFHATLTYDGPGSKPAVFVSFFKNEEGLKSYSLRGPHLPTTSAECNNEELEKMVAEFQFGCRPKQKNRITIVVQELKFMLRALGTDEVKTFAETVSNVEDSR